MNILIHAVTYHVSFVVVLLIFETRPPATLLPTFLHVTACGQSNSLPACMCVLYACSTCWLSVLQKGLKVLNYANTGKVNGPAMGTSGAAGWVLHLRRVDVLYNNV